MSDPSKRHEPADGHLPSRRELRGCLLGLLVFILVVAGIVIWLLMRK